MTQFIIERINDRFVSLKAANGMYVSTLNASRFIDCQPSYRQAIRRYLNGCVCQTATLLCELMAVADI